MFQILCAWRGSRFRSPKEPPEPFGAGRRMQTVMLNRKMVDFSKVLKRYFQLLRALSNKYIYIYNHHISTTILVRLIICTLQQEATFNCFNLIHLPFVCHKGIFSFSTENSSDMNVRRKASVLVYENCRSANNVEDSLF